MPETADGSPFRIGEAFAFAWSTFTGNWRFWLAAGAATGLLGLGLNAAETLIAVIFGTLPVLVAPLGLLALGAYVYIQTRVSIGIVSALLKAADGGQPQLADLWGDIDPFWRFLLAYIAFTVMLGIGLWLLVLPGLYVAARFGFYAFIVVGRRSGVIEAFRASSSLTVGHRWQLLLFWLIVLILNLVAAVPFGLGLVVSVPVCALAAVRIYRRIEGAPENLHVSFAGRSQ